MINLSNRLLSLAKLVRTGSRLADIGCDHGYVPVYLVQGGVCPSAIAGDINSAPLESCASLVRQFGLEKSISCVLSNGLDDISGDSIDDILIAGMGGELIADILDRCPYAKDKHIILNPMTHPEIARKWLYDNGYEIKNDFIVADGRHHYSVFDAYYTGQYTDKTDIDYFLGNINDFSDKEYFIHLLSYLKNKQKGGKDYSQLIKIIEEKI